MDGLKNYREKIKGIEKLVDKMESGELSIHELVELETLTGDLHERSIILKYKAFENKFEDSNSDQEDLEESLVEADAQHQDKGTGSDPVEDEMLEEAEELQQELEIESEPVEKELPPMDFSMFDEPEAEATKPEETKKPYQINLTQNDFIEDEIEKPEPVVEKTPEPVVEVEAEPEAKPKPVVEEPKIVVKEKGTSFLDRLSITDNSISSQLAGRKLDTLTGAFGINQRLLYINELFEGSGEAFSDAVKTLDTQSDLDAASDKVEEMAFKNSWNPEEEAVLEFLAIIKRRYA
jgi:hypothetical protein